MSRTLIQHGAILSMDPAIGDLARGDVLLEDERIVEVAVGIDCPEAHMVDATGCIVMPGLVQGHIHSWQTGLRGLGGDWAGSDYFNFFHVNVAPRFRAGDSYIATLLGALSQIDAGVTTMFEWCHNNSTPAHTDASVEGLAESGIRAVFGHGTVKPQPLPGERHFSQIPHPLAEIRRLREGRFASGDQLLTLAMCILGPDYSTLEVCRQDFRAAREFGLLSSAHVWGRANRLVPGGYRTIAEEGLLGPEHNLVHGNYIGDEELKVIVDSGASVTSTAVIELAHHVREPLSGRVARLGGAPSIGIDSEVSASGGMFDVMRGALHAQRLFDNQALARRIETEEDEAAATFARRNMSVIGTGGSMIEKVSLRTREVLEWATINNARALCLDHKIGSLTPGKQADLLILRRDSMNMLSAQDPVQAAVLYAQNRDVDTVFIAGQPVKRDGRLLYPHLRARQQALEASVRRLLEWRHAAVA